MTERRYTGGPSEARSTSRVEYDYDSCGANATYTKGRMCSVTAYDSSGNEFSKTAYTGYDALGRVRGSIQTTDTQSYTMSYEYDRSGNLTSQTYPSGKVVETVYDGAGRIAGVRRVEAGSSLSYYAGADGGTTAIGYAPHGGMREVLLGNGLWEQRRYNDRLQPTQIGLGTGKTAVGTGLGTADSGLLLLDYAYGTSANNGNVASQRIRAGTLDLTQSYTYDDLNRLKTASESGGGTPWSQTYSYDRYGNRAVMGPGDYLPSQALTPQSLNVFDTATNRLDGMNGMNTVTVAYDGAGNLTRDWSGNSFKYDGENRMVSFDTTGTDDDTTYYYDGEGRRVKKAVGGTGGPETIYVYNVAGQLVAEYATRRRPLSGTQYLTPDHLGSTRAVTGPDGAAVSRHDYLPFGEEILGRGGRTTALNYAADSMSGPAQKFTGKERDTDSGLDYFGARYFSGAGGRFTSADPENAGAAPADPQSWNGYAYARNNPLLYVDLLGLQPTYSYDLLTEQEQRILIATAEARGEEDGRTVYEGLSDAEANAYVNALRKLASVYSPAVSQIHSVEGFDRASVKLMVKPDFTQNLTDSGRFLETGDSLRSKGRSPFIGLEVATKPDPRGTKKSSQVTLAQVTLDIDLGNIAARGPARILGFAIHGVEFAVNDIYGGVIVERIFRGKRPATPQKAAHALERFNQFVSRFFRRNK